KPRISAKNGDTAPAAPDAPDESGRVRRNKKRVGQARPNGPDLSPQLDVGPEPSLLDYIAKTTLADDIRQLHADNPTRSHKWLARQSGQPADRCARDPGAGRRAAMTAAVIQLQEVRAARREAPAARPRGDSKLPVQRLADVIREASQL